MSFTPAILSRLDPRWKDENLGFDNSITIGTDGCDLRRLVSTTGFGRRTNPGNSFSCRSP